jgi:DNA primase
VPGGKDPDECLRSDGGVVAFQEALTMAPLMIDYELDKSVESIDIKSHTGRIEAARAIVPILAQIKNAIGRGEYIRNWSGKLNVREEELLADVGQYRRQNRLGSGSAQNADERLRFKASQKNAPKDGLVTAERTLLALYLLSKDDHRAVMDALSQEKLMDPVHQRIKDAADGIGKFNNSEDFQYQLMDRVAPDEEAASVLVDVILRVEELAKQNMPREVILKEFRGRILQEKLSLGQNLLRARLPKTLDDEEQSRLTSRIFQLKQLETEVLPRAQTDDQIADLKRKIDSLLLETTT